jgi:putative DNA primase/helicase
MLTEELQQLVQEAQVPPDLARFLDRNELGDAELFELLFADKVAYDHVEKRWYLWRGAFWEPDPTGEVFGMVGDWVAARYLDRATEERANGNAECSNQFIARAKHLLSKRRMKDVLDLGSHLPRLAIKGTEWDLPAMVLPVTNGIIDLASGGLRESRPSDFVRTFSPVAWQGLSCPSPIWEAALVGIFNGDAELVSFFQRLLGYCITGDTREQVMPILWGEGANGKSTVIETLIAVLGEGFCFTTQADSLMDFGKGGGDAPRPFLVASRNKRLILASESGEGRRLNSGLVKQLTGDASVTARALFGNPVTFKQTGKIILVTNHCPRLPDADDYAMWRRVLRVPFLVRFVDSPSGSNEFKRDKDLAAKLKLEAPGILAWLVQGCLEWQRAGLNPPANVLESTEKYRLDEDLTGQFVEERLTVGDGFEVTASALYRDYVQWSEMNGAVPMSARAFGQRMTRRFGEATQKWRHARNEKIYAGVGLVTETGDA